MNTQPHETFSEPETLAPCPQPNFKSLVVFGLKAMVSRRITPKMKSQFLRLMGKQIFQILSLCKWQPPMIIILVPLWVNRREYNLGKDQIGPQTDLTTSLIWGWISSKSIFWTKKMAFASHSCFQDKQDWHPAMKKSLIQDYCCQT